MTDSWKQSLQAFFAERGEAIRSEPLSREELAYVSGRDPRVWTDETYEDMISDIMMRTGANRSSRLLEVGCASGFLAQGLAPRVANYHGVDLAAPALEVARRLKLANATFEQADGEQLGFSEGSFDVAVCYDVFTNFPTFAPGEALISQMLRVVRPGGTVLVGSVPDATRRTEYEAQISVVSSELQDRFGSVSDRFARLDRKPDRKSPSWVRRLFMSGSPSPERKGLIECFYFEQSDFLRLAKQLGVFCSIHDVHSLNPYKGFRFNALFRRP